MVFEDLLKNPVKRPEEEAEGEDDGQDVSTQMASVAGILLPIGWRSRAVARGPL